MRGDFLDNFNDLNDFNHFDDFSKLGRVWVRHDSDGRSRFFRCFESW